MSPDNLPDLPRAARILLKFWKSARGPHVLPHRSAIDPIRLREWLTHLSIVEIHEGEKRFFVRLHGLGTMENIGQDFTRCYLEDCATGTATKILLHPYQASIDALMPTFSSVEADPHGGVFTSLDRLVMPFTDVDQEDENAPVSVDRLLAWVGPTDLLRGEDTAVYRAALPSASTNGSSSTSVKLTVVDVDDPRYRLDSPNQSSAPMAAARPEAKHA